MAEHLRRVDQARPGLIEALYLVGSVALGEYRPGVSDIDMLTVTARPLDPDDLAALAETHAAIPRYDGVYLDRATMAGQPDRGEAATFVVNGEFRVDQPCGELNPVIWLTLARYGISVRGPRPDVRLDRDRLRQYNLTNLEEYSRPLAGQIRAFGPGLPADSPVDADAIVWAVLGPPRLHATLATFDVIGKSAAGAYAAPIFPDFAELLGRVVSRRETREGSFVAADGLVAADLIDAVIDDAGRTWG